MFHLKEKCTYLFTITENKTCMRCNLLFAIALTGNHLHKFEIQALATLQMCMLIIFLFNVPQGGLQLFHPQLHSSFRDNTREYTPHVFVQSLLNSFAITFAIDFAEVFLNSSVNDLSFSLNWLSSIRRFFKSIVICFF